MLVFIDESGDTGLKTANGSSKYFVLSLILFTDHQEALACDRKIESLKNQMQKDAQFEFHFQNNSVKVRNHFLQCISSYTWHYFAVVIDKSLIDRATDLTSKIALYQKACQLLFSSAKPHLFEAIVVMDKFNPQAFQKSLKSYLYGKQKTNKMIKKLKQQNSHSNNLLQLADYVAGIINRKYQAKKDFGQYYQLIRKKELEVRQWPQN